MKLIPEKPADLVRKIASRPCVIYGMGYVGSLIAEWCDDNHINYVFSDSNADKKKLETDKKVVAPKLLATEYSDANIVIASINYYDEIKTYLNQLGFDDHHIVPYLLFWPQKMSWEELEESADWKAVKERARIFALWIDKSAESVADYSAEKNFLKTFLPDSVMYYSPDYIRFNDKVPFADFSATDVSFQVDVSSCLAILMSFQNPEVVIQHICDSTRKSIIVSYVTLEKLSNISFRRSINYINDFTETHLTKTFGEKGFLLKKKAVDPFDEVHSVYLFERQN